MRAKTLRWGLLLRFRCPAYYGILVRMKREVLNHIRDGQSPVMQNLVGHGEDFEFYSSAIVRRE